jgi:hypothetical protein
MINYPEVLKIVIGVEGMIYLNCRYGHGSFICDSYVSITREGAFHFCTQPSAHGFSLTLKEVLEIAREQGQQIEKQVRSYTDQLSKTESLAGAIEKTL